MGSLLAEGPLLGEATNDFVSCVYPLDEKDLGCLEGTHTQTKGSTSLRP